MIRVKAIEKRVIKNQIILLIIIAVFLITFYFLAIFTNAHNKNTFFGKWFWLFAMIIYLFVIVHSVISIQRAKKNKFCVAVNVADKMLKYSFLLKQLVIRDFKSKYKRSILGIFWSFLNPLLMMGTQYLIFSIIFKNNPIEYFPVYLLIGVIMFNLATEASNQGLTSIVSNANLINKVYVPKYIYTLSKVLSALINFTLSLIPLIIIMLCMKIWPSPYHLLIIFDFFLIFIFALGLAMFLATAMVFFRDMQFIWGVFTMMWMYATPIFYSTKQFEGRTMGTILQLNPMYHYLNYARSVLIYHTSPDLFTYLWCIVCSVLMFTIGAFVFKKNQDKFVLYV